MAQGDDDILKEAQEAFEICEAHEAEEREEALEDIRFSRLDYQWPEAIKRQREIEGRPCLTINMLPPMIRQVVNDARQNRPAITVHPASDGADDEVAQIYNGLIRNIEVTSDADVAYDTALDCSVTSGRGYWRVNTAYSDDTGFQTDLRIDALPNPFSIYEDPYSTAADSSDWNLAFVTETMTRKAFERQHKGADAIDWDSSYSLLDRPWVADDMVMLAEYWKREQVDKKIVALDDGTIIDLEVFKERLSEFQAAGVQPMGQVRTVKSHKVTQYLMTGAEVIETNAWAGKYIPIVPVYGEVVNIEGRRHFRSLTRGSRDAQRNFNYSRTSEVELGALAPKAPFIGPKGAFATDADKWETANTDNHAYIEYDGATPPQRQPYAGPPAGAIQAAMNAQADLKAIIGLFDASMGKADENSQEQSGRAILARMREGDVSTFHFIDNLSRAIRHTGRILIDMIPKVYSTPRIIRVMGLDGQPSQVPINQRVIPAPQAAGAPPALGGAQRKWIPAPQTPAMPPQTPALPQPGTPQPAGPPAQPQPAAMGLPMLGMGAAPPMPPGPTSLMSPPQSPPIPAAVEEKIFDLSLGKYDLTVEAGPSFTTKREEAATQMIALAQADPTILPLIGDILVKNLDWPGADEIAQRIAQARQQAQGGGQGNAQQGDAQAKLAQIQQEGQLKQQQSVQDHQLAIQQSQQTLQLEREEMQARMQIEQMKMEGQLKLQAIKAQFDAKLAQQSLDDATRIKTAEAARGADQSVSLPDITPGGGVG